MSRHPAPQIAPLRAPLAALRQRGQGSILRTVAALVFSQAINTAIGAALWLIATRLYTPAALGQSGALIGLASFLGTAALLGLDYTLGRYLPALDRAAQAGLVAASCLLTACAAILLSAVAFPLALPAEAPLAPRGLGLLAAGALGSASLVIGSVGDAALLAHCRPGAVAWKNVLSGLARVLAVVALAWTSAPAPVYLSFVASWLLLAWLTLAVLAPLLGRPSLALIQDGLRLLRQRWAYAGLNYLATLTDVAALSLLPLLVLRMAGGAQAGVFQVVWLLASLLFVVPTGCARALFAHESNGTVAPGQARALSWLLIAGMTLAAPLTALLGSSALALVGAAYVGGAGALSWIGASLGLIAYSSVRTARLRVAERVGWLACCSAVHLAALLGLAAALLPRMGLDGVGVAWFWGQALYALMVAAGNRQGARGNSGWRKRP